MTGVPTADRELRGQLSRLNALLVLAMLMNESPDEEQIIRLGAGAAPSFADCRLVGVHLSDASGGRWVPGASKAAAPPGIDRMPRDGGPLDGAAGEWLWAFPLGGIGEPLGHLVVAAGEEPPADSHFLLRALSQQVGAAIRNSRLHQIERTAAVELATVNSQLEHSVQALRQRIDVHDRLTQVAVSLEGMEGIARAVHEVTGLPVAIEDRYGNLRAWAGPDQPARYPKDAPPRREQLLRRMLREGACLWESGRVMRVASPRPDSVGVIALIDPHHAARDEDLAALDYGATILSLELARLRSIADTEIRIRRDLVEDLLDGVDAAEAIPRGEAFDHDLASPHRVIVFQGRGRVRDDELFFTAVRHACRDHKLGSLVVSRTGTVVLLAAVDVDWTAVHGSVMRELAGGQCRIGVGGRTSSVEDFPSSHQQALLALKLQAGHPKAPAVVAFDSLGVYRLLAATQDTSEIERFVEEWLGRLLAYDSAKHADLVATLHNYLECGGNYDATAESLVIHRSTLKYRLQRIREVSGLALGDPDINFNLQLACRSWRTLQALQS